MNYNEPTTSSSLIFRVKQDDEQAWGQLCEIYTPLVFQWARRAGLQDNDAGDVVQEVFRVVSSKMATLRLDRPGDKFRAWLWTVTRTELRAWFRKWSHGRGQGGTEALNQINAVPDWVSNDTTLQEIDPDDSAETELIRRAAEVVKGDFEPHTWQAFWRSTVDGHATADIAADLGMTSNAVRQAKFRVVLRLREMLG